MAGDSIEFDTLTSHAGIGFPGDIQFPLSNFQLATGLILTGATTPAAVNLLTNEHVIQWAANAAVTVLAAIKFTMPFDYAYKPNYPGRATATVDTAAAGDDFLKFYGVFRRQRAAADSATDFTPRATVFWWTPGTDTTIRSLTTNAVAEQASTTTGLASGTAYLPTITADNTADLTGFYPMVMDIGKRLRAEGKRIFPGDQVRILVGPDAVNANAIMQMSAAWLRYRKNACFNDMRMRGINL